MEMLIMLLRNEAEEKYLSEECKEKVIQEAVKSILKENFQKNKISSTEYELALDILKRYEV